MRLTSPSLLLEQLIQNVLDSLDAHTSALLLHHGRGLLRLEAYASLSDHIIPGALVEVGQGPVGWVMREQRPLNIARFKQDSRFLGIYHEDVAIKSFMAAPLPQGRGVIMVDSKTKLKFTDRDLKILKSFGRTAGAMIDCVDNMKQSRLLMDLLHWDVQAKEGFQDRVRAFMEIMSFTHCLVLRHVPGKDFFKIKEVISLMPNRYLKGIVQKRFPVGSGICGWVFKHSSNILLEGFGIDPRRSYLLEPEEEIHPKSTVLGLYFPASEEVLSLEHGLLFAGDCSVDFWPKGLVELLKKKFAGIVPWH